MKKEKKKVQSSEEAVKLKWLEYFIIKYTMFIALQWDKWFTQTRTESDA